MTSLAGATARLSQLGAEVADLRLLCTDLRAEVVAARAEAAAARAEAQRQQSELDRVVKERDQSRGRAETLAADLAVAQVAASEQRARAGGTPWPSSVFVPACFLCLCLRSFFWLFAELESALDESAKALAEALAGAAEQREADHAAMSEVVSDFCRVLGSGDVPSGSSPQSRLQVLGDHVRG
jgi:outer membrane murein-binding lipoprotein Lpp